MALPKVKSFPGKSSVLWPYIKAIGKSVSAIPGSSVAGGKAIDKLIAIQDEADKSSEPKQDLKAVLDAILAQTTSIAKALKEDGLDEIDEPSLTAATLSIAEALYLRQVADKYLYADFKGIEQLENPISLKLDDIFVNLKVVSDRPAVADRRGLDDDDDPGRVTELRRRLETGDPAARRRLEEELAEADAARDRVKAERPPETLDAVLNRARAVVLLGGPGSGKTTLLKRTARSFALGPDIARERYPALPWLFPIALPLATFDIKGDGRTLSQFLRDEFAAKWGEALIRRFDERWAAGGVLILLDGLDEIADAGRWIAVSRQVDTLVNDLGENRVVVSSRPTGYSLCRVAVPMEHVRLEPFGPEDIAAFVRGWYRAFDAEIHRDRPDPARAEEDTQALLADIEANERVQSLATNPLMLTIIDLIKHQHVVLPEKRVQLYEITLNTLIRSWNKARSLAQHDRPIGEAGSPEASKKTWAAVADWMHRDKSTGTCSGAQLQEKVVEFLMKQNPRMDDEVAIRMAESYITAAAETSGLLSGWT